MGVCPLLGLQGKQTKARCPLTPELFVDLSPPLTHNSLIMVMCLGNYLKPFQHELGNKAPVVFSAIPKNSLVFNR